MTNPIIKIHNVETGEVIEREMNAEELAQLETDRLAAQAKAEAEAVAIETAKAEAAAKAHERAALLERLGITEEEAALLLGGN
jgi:peptidoglycan hydrolase CwlO-like protein